MYIPVSKKTTKINQNINRTKERIVIIVALILHKIFLDKFTKSSKAGFHGKLIS